MSSLNLENLKACFEQAFNCGFKYVAVKVRVNSFPEDEIIINKNGNIADKLAYYQNAYNDDLTLKANNNIRIVDFCFGDSLSTIERSFEKHEN